MDVSRNESMAGKVALVTGATSGIGRASAWALARAGASVVLGGRREGEGRALADGIRAEGGRALFAATDVRREADVAALVEAAQRSFGRLDIAFNNAGFEGLAAPLHEQTDANYDDIMDTNVRGVFWSMKHEIPAMLASGGGSIVNNASMGSFIGFPSLGIYVASKHAVLGLTRTAALELIKSNIRVNAVCPGLIDTALQDRLWGDPGLKVGFAAGSPAARLGTANEVAQAVLFLAGPGASFVSGHALTVDGAYTTA